ncbi:hypothetical protein EJ04DRAFT_599911, partial [Polyplosphaeria fusca]
LITSITCYSLLGLHLSGHRGSESLAEWTIRNRAIVAIIVQLLSQLLAVIHVHVICATVRSSFLVSISAKPFRLHAVHFIQAVTAPIMTWSIPWPAKIVLLMAIAASVVPAPLWAAAMTPLLATQEVTRSIDISTFRVSNTSAIFEGDGSVPTFGGSPQWLTSQGLFGFDISSPLKESASVASAVINGYNNHAKLDQTGYIYQGRSYGAGGDAGFTEVHNTKALDSYQYTDRSFFADISCFYNESMEWEISQLDRTTGTVAKWQFQRTEHPKAYFTYLAWLRNDLFAWNTVYNNRSRKISVNINTGAEGTDDEWSFKQFSKLQCDIGFEEREFRVFINNTERLIVSRPVNDSTLTWPEYGDAVAEKVASDIGSLSWTDSCFGGCRMGLALVTNINYLINQTSNKSNATTIQGTEDFFASIVDNDLVRLRLTRLVSHAVESTEKTDAVVIISAIVFGDRKFVWIVAILNFLILSGYFIELIRTQGWAATPPFDIMNDTEVVVAAFEGGRLFERNTQTERDPESHRESISGKTTLSLHYKSLSSERPVFMPHSTGDGTTLVSAQDGSLENSLNPSPETMPLVEIRN